jgi:uncharacterized membrane protein
MWSKMSKQTWCYLLFLLLSHHPQERLHRTIHIRLKRKNIYLCSRCTGTFLGIISILSANILGLRIPIELYFPLIAFLPLAAAVDWFTQSAKRRESKNWLRVCSGFLLGTAEALCLLLLINGFFLHFLLTLGIFSIYALSIYLIAAKTKCLDAYIDEFNRTQSIPN